MMTIPSVPSYKGYRFPSEIISHAVWWYFRCSLSYRDVDELLAARGMVVTYETIRQWCQQCGQSYAHHRRRRRAQPGDTWHLDAVFLKINGKTHYLWRAVDQHGMVRDMLVQSRRTTAAAKTFFRKLRKRCQYVPRVSITDTLASSGAAQADVRPRVEHRQHKRRNNRVEHAHQPTRQRERIMRHVTSAGHAQRLLATHDLIRNHCCFGRHRMRAYDYRRQRQEQLHQWYTITGRIIVGYAAKRLKNNHPITAVMLNCCSSALCLIM